ncbi:MAG TPA: ABC transporter substrate-binding protein [Candidatus Binatia bacterium]|nr:ABC transporter substrate-binding protein [Candidatus Binatia bacterium]
MRYCAILLVLLLCTFLNSVKLFALDKFVWASSTKGVSNAFIYMGIEKGFFAQEDIEFIPVYTRTQTANTALITKQVHGSTFSITSPGRILTANVFSLSERAPFDLIAGRSISQVGQLPGKSIAVSGAPGGTTEASVVMLLKRLQVNPESITFIAGQGGSGVLLQMLDVGAADAAALSIPYNFIATKKGFKKLVELSQHIAMIQGINVLGSFVKERRPFLKKVLKGLVRSHMYSMSHPQETIDWLVKNTGLQPDIGKDVFDRMRNTSTRFGIPSDEAIATYATLRNIPVNSYFYDYAPLEEAIAELGIKRSK